MSLIMPSETLMVKKSKFSSWNIGANVLVYILLEKPSRVRGSKLTYISPKLEDSMMKTTSMEEVSV